MNTTLTPLLRPGKTDQWYTPPDLLQEIVGFLGDDYLDPCPAPSAAAPSAAPSAAAPPLVDGLQISWGGQCVYVNPPYGRAIGPWIAKCVTEPVEELVLLVPARTDTKWFQLLWEHMDICFIRGRLFFTPGLQGSLFLQGLRERPFHAPFPSALAYRGPRSTAFSLRFAHLGPVVFCAGARGEAYVREKKEEQKEIRR